MQADLFCRVVDNYGDIGVSWRIARQLHLEHGWKIRLWVDDLHAFKRIEPTLNDALETQFVRGVEVRTWRKSLSSAQPLPVVIAAFSCEPPPAWLPAMKASGSLWINLEYLSAERWVEDCHGIVSIRPDGLKPYFFFPGFTDRTGGLPRERGLIDQRLAWTCDHEQQASFLHRIGLTADLSQCAPDSGRPRIISLFCYPQAPYHALMETLRQDQQRTIVLIPEGVCPGLSTGQSGNVQVLRIPFLSQDDYDRLLWSCDLNFVRGEDSFLRATWAGKPFIWQIYPQQENAHLTKLEAWLARTGLPAEAQSCLRAWNQPDHPLDFTSALRHALEPNHFLSWQASSASLSERLAEKRDLASSIVDFCLQSNIYPDRIK